MRFNKAQAKLITCFEQLKGSWLYALEPFSFMASILVLLIILGSTAWYLRTHMYPHYHGEKIPIDAKKKAILADKVDFYKRLRGKDRRNFEYRVMRFLSGCKITGVSTDVTEEDRVLVAASAIIPVFGFEEWDYSNLNEVLLYPDTFNPDFETNGKDRNISGMVGWGFMNGTMTLSKPSLHLGFSNKTSKENVGIHEFVHLIDKMDGATDGVPDVLIRHPQAIPWLKMMKEEIHKIAEDDSDIRPYGATNQAEFYSVASEYFFKRPRLFKKKHPQLYKAMTIIFKQNPAEPQKEKVSTEDI